MSNQATWGSTIWGAVKIVGGVTVAALVLPAVLTNLGSLVSTIGGETATAVGNGLTSAGTGLSGLTSTVASTVVGTTSLPSTFAGLGTLAQSAGSSALEAAGNVGTYIMNNPGKVAGAAGAGLAIGYMIRGAEAGASRRPVVGPNTANLAARQAQLAALTQNARA